MEKLYFWLVKRQHGRFFLSGHESDKEKEIIISVAKEQSEQLKTFPIS